MKLLGRSAMGGYSSKTSGMPRVLSSDHSKTYQVETSADGHEISSNDNASYWQGYLGYPAIAVMLKRGLCPLPAEAITALSGIPWKELNRHFRNDYSRTIEEVMRRAEERGFDSKIIAAEAEAVSLKLSEFAPLRGSRRRPARLSVNMTGAPATNPPRSARRPDSKYSRH